MNRCSALHTALVTGLLFVTDLTPASASPQLGRPLAQIAPPKDRIGGKTYAEWSAAWWQWSLGLPAVPGHPTYCDQFFDVTLGQSGEVWFLAAPFFTCAQTIAIPEGTSLFLAMANVEASSLEAPPFFGATEAAQRAAAKIFADYIQNPFCEVDGVALRHVDRYRFSSPQFTFTVPNPNIIGTPPGTGTAVSDGYWAMIRPLTSGQHTIHFGGTFVAPQPYGTFDVDMTYFVTVY